jgi:hypothetical protein
MLAVLEAEPAEYRDWLPEHIRVDPAGEIAAAIARAEVEIADLRREQRITDLEVRSRAIRRRWPEGTHERRHRLQLESLRS